jgi:putative spermidine/putrescine transport system permease protein
MAEYLLATGRFAPVGKWSVMNVIRRQKREHWLLLFPTLTVFCFFFLIPLLYLFVISFHPCNASSGVESGWTLGNYKKFFTDPFYMSILWRTVKIGLVTTLVALIVAYPVAYHLVQTIGRKRNYLTLLLLSPLLISMVIRNYGWIIMLATNGVVNNTLIALGLIHEPLKLLYSEVGVEIGMVHVLFPYMVLSIVGSLERIDPSVLLAAQNLGAGPIRTFFSIVFPLSLPGVFAGSVMVFSLATSSYVTPSILGGPKVKVMSYLTYEQVAVMLNWPYGGAIGFILVLMTTLTLALYSGILKKSKIGAAIR